MVWDWIGKNSSTLMFLILIIGWVWSIAVTIEKIKDNQKRISKLEDWGEDLEKEFNSHEKNVTVHRDPARDEQRLTTIERKIDDMMRLLIEMKRGTKGLT